ncbi:MAG TPA: 50S ribosomal protein L19 [Candidatus Saccharimonadales bacterium]|nr:50S ribosomal protein L19 [Candidatus Saccharimonadales bacterium]
MSSVIDTINAKQKKKAVVDVRSGDTVRVHQKIREGNKERIQIFQGLVIRTDKKGSHTSRITVRRISSGVGVEKSFLLHSPLVVQVEVTKRSKVRRNYLSYMRQRTGKAARLSAVDFDSKAVNDIHDAAAEAEEAKLHEQAKAEAAAKAEEKAAEEAKNEAKVAEALAAHDDQAGEAAADAKDKDAETK